MATLLSHIEAQLQAANDSTLALILLGVLLSLSIVVDTVSRRTALPRISLLVLVGVGYAVVQQLVIGSAKAPLEGLREPLINLALV
ncbi:MAG: cation:proton antiporter, partial [Pseudomonadota bacterium]